MHLLLSFDATYDEKLLSTGGLGDCLITGRFFETMQLHTPDHADRNV